MTATDTHTHTITLYCLKKLFKKKLIFTILGRPQPWWCRNNRNAGTNGRNSLSAKHSADSIRRPTSNSGVWTWLGGSRRSSEGPDQIGPPSSSPAENHYTHMDDAYSPVGVSEALYAELDRESVRSNNPSYQNTGYSQCGDVSRHIRTPIGSPIY